MEDVVSRTYPAKQGAKYQISLGQNVNSSVQQRLTSALIARTVLTSQKTS